MTQVFYKNCGCITELTHCSPILHMALQIYMCYFQKMIVIQHYTFKSMLFGMI